MLPTQELPVRVLALLVYTGVAIWVALNHTDTALFVLHSTGAIGGLCALSLAVTYAGLIGKATPGPVADQARDYMDSEDWDD